MATPLLIAAAISTSLVMGLASRIFSAVAESLEERLQLSERRLKRMHAALVLAYVPLMPVAGRLVDSWDLLDVLFLGALLLSVAISWIGLCRNLKGLFWGVAGLALGTACLATAGVNLMAPALSLHPRGSTGAALALGFVFVGLAALLTAPLLERLVRLLGFQKALLTAGFSCLIPAGLAALIKGSLPAAAAAGDGAALLSIPFALLMLLAFSYAALNMSLEIWVAPYLHEIGYSGRSLFRLVVAFWAGYLLCRFGLTWMIRSGNEAWLVLVLLAAAAMLLGNLTGAYAANSGYWGFWLVGAACGPLWPALLALAIDTPDLRGMSGQAVGILLALTALGALITRPLLESFAKAHAPRECIRIPMLISLAMAAPVLMLALMKSSR